MIKKLKFTKTISCTTVSPIISENIFIGEGDAPAIFLRFGASPLIKKNFISEYKIGIHMHRNCAPIIKNNIIIANDVGIQILWDDMPHIINNTIVAPSIYSINLLSYNGVKIENNILMGALYFDSQSYISGINYNNIGH